MQKRIPGLNLPIRSIFCIGRNYASHAKEMNAPIPESPVVFIKPLNTICFEGASVPLPPQSREIHHEVELVVAIGNSGKDIPAHKAYQHIAGFGIGIDFTARDIQQKAKENGLPWTIAKGFDHFAPISSFIPLQEKTFPTLTLQLSVNNHIRQHDSTSNMIFEISSLISYLSSIFTLQKGDLIFTGTPEGVSAVQAGDIVTASIPEYQLSLTVNVV